MGFKERREEIENWEPSEWDMSSSIAYRMFRAQQAEALQILDDEERPPSRWQLFKRRLG